MSYFLFCWIIRAICQPRPSFFSDPREEFCFPLFWYVSNLLILCHLQIHTSYSRVLIWPVIDGVKKIESNTDFLALHLSLPSWAVSLHCHCFWPCSQNQFYCSIQPFTNNTKIEHLALLRVIYRIILVTANSIVFFAEFLTHSGLFCIILWGQS